MIPVKTINLFVLSRKELTINGLYTFSDAKITILVGISRENKERIVK